jgi:hypothetical protein
MRTPAAVVPYEEERNLAERGLKVEGIERRDASRGITT